MGKSTFCASIPDALFAATEPGLAGIRCYQYNAGGGGVTSWDIFTKMIDELEKTDRFRVIVVDTIARLYDHCLLAVSKRNGMVYPEDHGKTWTDIRREMLYQFERILVTGRGLWFVAHQKERSVRTRSAYEYAIIQPAITDHAAGAVLPLVNFLLYATRLRDAHGGKEIRALVATGTEHIVAGCHAVKPGQDVPRLIELKQENGYQHFLDVLEGRAKPLTSRDVVPLSTSPESLKPALRGA